MVALTAWLTGKVSGERGLRRFAQSTAMGTGWRGTPCRFQSSFENFSEPFVSNCRLTVVRARAAPESGTDKEEKDRQKVRQEGSL